MSANTRFASGSSDGPSGSSCTCSRSRRRRCLQVTLTGGRSLQLRIEAYNVFDTTQCETVDTSARFDLAAGEQLNRNFGRVTGVRTASHRIGQSGRAGRVLGR